MDEKRPIRVAVVGSGMAGLVTAWLLHRDPRQRYSVKLFESGDCLSLDSASVSIPNASRMSSDRIDLPMRAFAGGFYSNLKAMYDYLGVQYHSQRFLFEFAKVDENNTSQRDGRRDSSYFVHASNFHQSEPRPKAVATVAYVLEVIYLLACYAWFTMCCFLIPPRRERGRSCSETLGQYLSRVWIPEYFITYYILPLMSSVSTCPHDCLLGFPASDVLDYKRRTHGAAHYTVSEGVKGVQDLLVRGIDHELSAAVLLVEPRADGVKVSWNKTDEANGSLRTEWYDRAILAVAPDIVGQIFEPLRYHMARIPTTMVESVVHNDRHVLGSDDQMENDDHSAQLIYLRTSTQGSSRTESFHIQPCGAIVTTCPFSTIDPSLTIRSARFTRVLRSPESRDIVNSLLGDTQAIHGDEKLKSSWKNGEDNIWLVGGWCWDGMVLLEGCIVSAMRVADAFGVEVPWRIQGAPARL